MVIVHIMGTKPPSRQRAGFSFVELMVVMAIIVLLAAVAGFAYLRARVTTSGQIAFAAVRHYNTNLQLYFIVKQQYPADLTLAGPPTSDPPFLTPNYIGDGTTATKQGYTFVYTSLNPTSYTLVADPVTPGITGERHFFTDETMTVRFTDQNRTATSTDPPVL